MGAWRWALAIMILCAAPAAETSARPGPKAAAAATIVAFTGWIPIFFSVSDSAVVTIVEGLRARGLAAEVHDPAHWAAVGAELIGPRRPAGPIVLVGYSMGAGAVTQLAAYLGRAGIPVRAAIMLENWNAGPVPANVGHAVHYYVTSSASPVSPGPGFSGAIRNVDLRGRIPGIETHGHVAMSKLKAVQDIIVGDVLTYASASRRR